MPQSSVVPRPPPPYPPRERDRGRDRDRDRDRGATEGAGRDRYGERQGESKGKDSHKAKEPEPLPEPVLEKSGKLYEEENKVEGVTMKYVEPPGAKMPDKKWRLYPFKDGNPLGQLACLSMRWPRRRGEREMQRQRQEVSEEREEERFRSRRSFIALRTQLTLRIIDGF